MKQLFFFTTLIFASCGQNEQFKSSIDLQLASSVNVSGNESKIDVALTFINSYVENCNKMKQSIGIVEWVNASDLVTNKFKRDTKSILDEAKQFKYSSHILIILHT